MSIVAPRADEREEALEDLDWDIPCEYSMHGRLSHTEPAEFAIWFRAYPICGHLVRPFAFFCLPCWEWRAGCRTVRCNQCNLGGFEPFATVVKVERI